MAIWDPADELNHPLDFLLVKNGFVTLFCQRTILDETVTWLRDSGYRVAYVDASSWLSQSDMHRDIAEVLKFPGYYGSNLDSLNDCLGDVAVQSYGWSGSDTGLVLVIDGYDEFAERDEDTAHRLLDTYARQAAYAALFGYRLMCLVRSADPWLQIGPVGGTPVTWNYREVVASSRRTG